MGITMSYDSHNHTYWYQWDKTSGELQQELNYSNSGYNYRSWSPESSATNNNLGLLVSLKIDWANGIGDDHIILLVGFMNIVNQGPTMVFAQTSVQFSGDNDDNIMSAPQKSNPSAPTNLGDAVYTDLQKQICGFTGNAAGRNNLPNIARANVNALIGTVSL